jgi:ATP adenylyltransferase
MMQILWAPWRLKYIKAPKEKGCFLCKYIKSKNDKKNLILYRGKTAFIILNRYPYNSGHLMVAPIKHSADFSMLTDAEQLELIKLTARAIDVLKKSFAPMGFNIGVNLGRVAGAGLEDHLHFHVVPRWNGDTNFMPATSSTKVMPQLLDETYKILKKFLK